MNTIDRLSFLGMLQSEGIEMYLDAFGNLRARGVVNDPEIAGWIRANRKGVIGELEKIRARQP